MRANGDDLAGLHAALSEQSARYADLRTPLEIVHGERDWLLTVDRHARGLAALAPHAGLSIAPSVGHMAHHARPDLLEAAIERIAAQA